MWCGQVAAVQQVHTVDVTAAHLLGRPEHGAGVGHGLHAGAAAVLGEGKPARRRRPQAENTLT